MALDPLTWLLISASIIAAYCIALKLSEGSREIQIKENPEPWPPTMIPREPEPQVIEVSADVIQTPEEPSPPSRVEEQPENRPKGPPETRNGSEEKAEESGEREEGPRPEPISRSELMRLEKEIKELKILVEMSAELKKELEKLVKMIKTQKPGKTVN
ncbi:MAG TPA: hypothetical protein ENG52_00985 [Nitrososphaeria archaeon]|nr:hypothetical protein [Nitrososphaeria archaeon]